MQASTIVEVSIEQDAIRVQMEIGGADILAFRNVLPDEIFERLTGESTPLEERVGTFFRDDWRINVGDTPLNGRIERVNLARRVLRDDITGDPLPIQPDDAETVVRVGLGYELTGQPETISIRPPTTSDNTSAASIGFVVYHLGVAVNDFRYLARTERLHLDWDDSWYSAFESRTLRRRYAEPAAAFLYVENFSVRKEIIFRAKDLQQWVDLGLAKAATVPAARRHEICQTAAAYLHEQTPVRIDGESVTGELDRVHFIQRTLRSSGVVEPDQDIPLNTALIGAIFVYPTENLPQQIMLEWKMFNERVTRVPTVATDEAGGLPGYLETEDSTLAWTNFLTNPSVPEFLNVRPPQRRSLEVPLVSFAALLLALGVAIAGRRIPGLRRSAWAQVLFVMLIGSVGWSTKSLWHWRVDLPGTIQPLDTQETHDVVHSLLHNLYRAFDFREEGTIYDVLNRSVTGDLLTDIYVETRRSLTLANQGGARVKVTDLEMIECIPDFGQDGSEFRANCTWRVTGTVGHWGHVHQRQNEYIAECTMKIVEGQWKIVGMEMEDERRL